MTFGLVEILGGIAGIAFLIMSMMVKSSRSGKKAAEAERDKAIKKAESAEKRIKAHEKRQEIESDIALGDHPNTDGVRDPYDRG